MQLKIFLLFIFSIIVSFTFAYFQYFHKKKTINRHIKFLFILRSLVFSLLFLLLINPTVDKYVSYNVKPLLSILIDNSKSIKYFKEEQNILNFKSKLLKDKKILERFNIQFFSFGEQVKKNDSLFFLEPNTNIQKALFGINKLNHGNIAPIILLTDGNQTIGSDYEFFLSKQKIYPVVFGDTLPNLDTEISQINVNRYSYLKNKFPVEILLNYSGKTKVNSKLTIQEDNKIIFSKKITFSNTNNSQRVKLTLPSNRIGKHIYKASLKPLNKEKNIRNNSKSFTVEVVDKQTKILILYEKLHPDLGVLKKAIESNKQRKVTLSNIKNFKNNLKDYQLVVFFNANEKFQNVYKKTKLLKKNIFLITGTGTNWDFINQLNLGFKKKISNNVEYYTPIYNRTYDSFVQIDLGFTNFPPLKDYNGKTIVEENAEILLFQQIRDRKTKDPLLFTIERNNQKVGVLLGEGIWKWRASSFLNSNSFEKFDNYLGSLIQYLTSTNIKKRLDISIKPIYQSNEILNIDAYYTDKNYKFNTTETLKIQLKNKKTEAYFSVPFQLQNNYYSVALENLPPGTYSYKVFVLNKNISKSGTFKITEFDIEKQYLNANTRKLRILAKNCDGKLFFKNQFKNLREELFKNKNYYPVKKQKLVKQQFIDWQWVLIVIISLLTLEWIIRKYFGKI